MSDRAAGLDLRGQFRDSRCRRQRPVPPGPLENPSEVLRCRRANTSSQAHDIPDELDRQSLACTHVFGKVVSGY